MEKKQNEEMREVFVWILWRASQKKEREAVDSGDRGGGGDDVWFCF